MVQRENSLQSPKSEERVLITGDDVLIEYVTRLFSALKMIKEDDMLTHWRMQI